MKFSHFLVLSSNLLLTSCGFATLVKEDYYTVDVEMKGGSLEISLHGEYTEYKVEGKEYIHRKSPYYLLIRYVKREDSCQGSQLKMSQLKLLPENSQSNDVLLDVNLKAETFNKANDNSEYVGFVFKDLALPYENYRVSFALDECGEKTTVNEVLYKNYSNEIVHKWLYGLNGI